MTQPAEGWLASGGRAMATGSWAEAREAFTAALEEESLPEALAGLGESEWWLGATVSAIEHLGDAYAGFLRLGKPVPAAICAVRICLVCVNSLGRRAVARGWLRRAQRLVEDHALEPLRGWVLLLSAVDAADPQAAERACREATALAERFADRDLELCARSQLGATLVQLGRVDDGTALLDETMAGALAGEGRRLDTVVYTSCNTLTACSRVAELTRALEWIRAAAAFTQRYGNPHLFTLCRVHHARLLFLTGDWAAAEEHYREALHAGREAEPAVHGEAVAGLAELRLAQGRLEEAEQLLQGLEGHVVAARVRGALLLARGQPAVAREVLARALRELDLAQNLPVRPYAVGAAACIDRAAVMSLMASAAVDAGHPDQALATAETLARLGEESACDSVRAAAALAHSRALLATHAGPDAAEAAERALALYNRLALPLEAARSRLQWARARASEAPEAAVASAGAALAAFEDLGAGPDADVAAAFLRDLGARAARRGPRGIGLLTRREREVLALLEEGLTNRDVGERLHISLKTVEYHVRNVLSKLGMRSRAEAAAYAARHLHGGEPLPDPLDD